jgi:D-alanine--poly(phosphoribitol) ligase subunit 1
VETPVRHPSMIEGAERVLDAPSIVHIVQRHAQAVPDAIAVQSGGALWTYREIWHRSLAVAAALREAGVGPGDRVALSADRTAGTIAAAIGVMAVRAAYVPFDPTHPAERIDAVIAGSRPVAMVHEGPAPVSPAITTIDLADIPLRPAPVPDELPRPDDVAYVVLTSGSTGAPKGVLVEHASLVNYTGWCSAVIGTAGVGSPLLSSLGYDLAMTSLWVPLSRGERVVTVSGVWDQDTLFGYPEPYTFIKMTPSHARFFEVMASPPYYAKTTEALMFGGEGLDPALIRSLGTRADGVRLINHYGPTETTIGCCAYQFDNTRIPDLPTVPIGTPVWNSRAYVLDENLRPAREGELVIAGRAVAAGYLGDSGGDKFIDDADLGGRAYRTGDIVELLADGTLLYLGRRDHQFKVSGHRVELGELRHHALAVPGVAHVAFEVVRGDVDTLEAFVVVDGTVTGEDFGEILRGQLARTLPPAVVPNNVHVVPELRVDGNGKLDLRATRRRMDHSHDIEPG